MQTRFFVSTLALLALSILSFADGPFGTVPGEPIKPIPHYTPNNAPRKKTDVQKYSDSVIFNALTTPAKNGTKFVAGLTCTLSKCSLAEKGSKEYDDYKIFVAINEKPKDVTSPLIAQSKTFEKQIGRLTCTETLLKANKAVASYSCKLN